MRNERPRTQRGKRCRASQGIACRWGAGTCARSARVGRSRRSVGFFPCKRDRERLESFERNLLARAIEDPVCDHARIDHARRRADEIGAYLVEGSGNADGLAPACRQFHRIGPIGPFGAAVGIEAHDADRTATPLIATARILPQEDDCRIRIEDDILPGCIADAIHHDPIELHVRRRHDELFGYIEASAIAPLDQQLVLPELAC